MAAAAIAACIVQAAYYLDVRLRYDEAQTIAIAMQPFGVAASKYDAPNNHVLHTLLVWVAHEFGDLNRVVLRMPAFLSFCLFLPLLWRFVRREYGAMAGEFAAVFVGASWFFLLYATNARGYTLLLLLFVVALLCGQALVRSPDRKTLWAIWALTIAAGLYTIPLMIFPAVLTASWMLLVRRARTGGQGLRPFALRIAAWGAVALVSALLLYLPIFAGDDVQQAIRSGTYMSPLAVIGNPVVLWREWHTPIPPWARGVLLALVVVGATAKSRSCGKAGSLLLATGLAWVLVLGQVRILSQSRYLMWALLVFMILAGAGAACVFEGVMSRVRSRWPDVATVRMRRVLEVGLLALVFGTFSSWFSSYDLTRGDRGVPRSFSSEITSSVVKLMRPGDYFTIGSLPRDVAWFYIRLHHTALPWQGVLWPPDASGWRAYRISASTHRHAAGRSSAVSEDDPLPGRLFVFDLVTVDGRSRYFSRARTTYQYLEAREADYEVVAGFGTEMRGGGVLVYVLNDWTPH